MQLSRLPADCSVSVWVALSAVELGRLHDISTDSLQALAALGTTHSTSRESALMGQSGLMTFPIRTATPRDVGVLRDLYRRSSLSNNGDRADLLAHPDTLVFDDAPVAEERTRVAVDGDHIVGFATIRLVAEIAELDDLFVDPDWMRRGVGRGLLLDAVAIARSLSATRIEVTANGHALDFYESVGFLVDGVSETELGSGLRMHADLFRRSTL
jgi:ribosomal protein S18 acetylase RimI-like enzyme